ncbi:hypothetical protein PFISCL1PPCAC_27728, partial [Pristionchus fissidentatus]
EMRPFIVFLFLFFSSHAFRQKSVAVKGKLMCGEQNLGGAKVKLWDKNILEDDLLAEGVTDANGNFELLGRTSALFKMKVYFKVYHDCADGVVPCQRKVSLRVPDDFVFRAETPEKIFNTTALDMSTRYQNEKRSCMN